MAKIECGNTAKVLTVVGVVVLGIGLLLLCILLPLSYTYVNPNFMAFQKDTVSNLVFQDVVFSSGRYLWGPQFSAVTFPTTYQKISFPPGDLLVFSKDGLEFSLAADVFYKLEASNLKQIYSKFGTSYSDRFADAMKASLKNSATRYSVDDFVTRREEITEFMLVELNQDLQQLFIQVDDGKLLLRRIGFPSSIETKFLQTAIQELENEKAVLIQEVELINKETSQIIEGIRANITIVQKTSIAEAETIVRNSAEQAKNIVQRAVGDGINGLLRNLNATSDGARKALFELFTIQDSPDGQKTLLGDLSTIINFS